MTSIIDLQRFSIGETLHIDERERLAEATPLIYAAIQHAEIQFKEGRGTGLIAGVFTWLAERTTPSVLVQPQLPIATLEIGHPDDAEFETNFRYQTASLIARTLCLMFASSNQDIPVIYKAFGQIEAWRVGEYDDYPTHLLQLSPGHPTIGENSRPIRLNRAIHTLSVHDIDPMIPNILFIDANQTN